MLCVLFLAEAVRLPSPPQFSHASRACAPSATAAAPAAPAASKLMPPRDREDMLQQAAACVRAARADAVGRSLLHAMWSVAVVETLCVCGDDHCIDTMMVKSPA